MLGQRLFYGALLIAALIGLVVADSRLSLVLVESKLAGIRVQPRDGFLVVTIVSILIYMASGEFFRLCVLAGSRPVYRWSTLTILALIWVPYFSIHSTGSNGGWEATVISLLIGFLGVAIGVAARRQITSAISDLAASLFMIVYLGLLAQFLVRLRLEAPSGAAWLLLYYVGVTKFCDIGAYFTGRALGRTKLIEWLSPKKTIEGLLGGVALSMFAAWLIPVIVARASTSAPVLEYLPTGRHALLFGLVMALLGQAGDLLESLVKRAAQSKDAAAKVPAFGGILDILDSVLLTAPAAYWILLR